MFIFYLQICAAGIEIELCCRCVLYLFQHHQSRLLTTSDPVILTIISRLNMILRISMNKSLEIIGTNVAALKYSNRFLAKNSNELSNFDQNDQSKRKISEMQSALKRKK